MVKKPKRGPSGRESRAMQATAIRMPTDLHERLVEAGTKSGKGFSREFRERLEASFEAPDGSPQTMDLVARIARLAAEIEGLTGRSWAENAHDFSVLKAGIELLLRLYQPEGGAEPPAKNSMYYVLSYGDEGPEKAGVAIARPLVSDLVKQRQRV